MIIQTLFDTPLHFERGVALLSGASASGNQEQTNATFSEKWEQVAAMPNLETLYQFQFDWYLRLYGFGTRERLREFLTDKQVIFDAGCGLGYKAAWFATLAPHATVVGMDFSDAVFQAAALYKDVPNLFWVQGDIADTHLLPGSVDYVSCDQVIMHTEHVEKTFSHLTETTAAAGEFACYVYAKKALPRELLDDHFRHETHTIPSEALWAMSRQLTQLGRTLSELNVTFTAPDIPLLGIKGGVYDVQRFIYWNFLKCFWREEWGPALCDATNFDWYSPSNARRFSEAEYRKLIADNRLQIEFFHHEEACYSGRFRKCARII